VVVQSFVVARACLELWKAPDDLDAIDVGQHAVDCHHDIVVMAAKYQSLLTVRGPVNPVDDPGLIVPTRNISYSSRFFSLCRELAVTPWAAARAQAIDHRLCCVGVVLDHEDPSCVALHGPASNFEDSSGRVAAETNNVVRN